MLSKRILASIAAGVLTAALAVVAPSASSQAEVSAQACTYTDWVQGQWYTTGSIVRFEGNFYIAEHDNPGYSPTVSTWYWEPTSCDGGGGGGGTCTYTDWVQGQWYVTGAIVRFEGNFYIAEHDNPGYSPTVSTWYWEPYNCNGGGGGGGGGDFVVSEAQFNQMFPSRNSFYSYRGLVQAMGAYPAFAKTGSDTVKKQEAAAFLANVSHETGGLVHIREINQGNDLCDESKPYGCPAGTYGYYGRGPIQLSWNFNYYSAGIALGVDLLRNPDLVATDSAISWKTGLWYWNTQTGPGWTTGHNAMVNGNGFGETIRSINGSLECNGGNPAQVQSRVSKYQQFVGILGVPAGVNLYC